MADDKDKPIDRRKFFRMGLAEILRPLASVAGPLSRAARVAHELGKLDQIGAPANASARKVALNVWLRPPGALVEQKFRETCSKCGECVNVCPAQAIQLDHTGVEGLGAPFIKPDTMACVVCEGLKCMSVCPSGALVPTSINDIDMGTAVWHEETCVRSRGELCTICVDQCPLGSAAIELKGNHIAVKPLGCIGCGVCQHECPTVPKSIVVIPIAAKTAV
ncbi:MAG: 4Fe-4S dicluster domain-containing protein [Planctomycetota bacterium]|nr:4Fe-4S dicluster domain-containing protein [Planctomycetota bacterium]